MLKSILTLALLLALLAGPAHAHEELSLHAMTVLRSVTPQVPGLEVRVVHMGAPALAIRNETGKRLTVLDENGRPFLRVGRSGVFVNAESPLSYRSIDPARDGVPDGLNGPARWTRIGRGSAWSWFDPRLTFDREVSRWSIAMRLDGNRVTARGGFEPLDAHGHFKTQLDVPTISGLEVRTAEGPVPGMFVRNDTGATLHVEGLSGEPFLRIGPRGVFANVRSPSYFMSAMQRIERVPADLDPTVKPEWKRVSSVPVWAWLERRAAVPPSLQERDVLGSEQRTVLEWTTQMRLGDEDASVEGRVLWVPPHVSDAAPEERGAQTYWTLVVVVLVACLGFGLRARRFKVA